MAMRAVKLCLKGDVLKPIHECLSGVVDMFGVRGCGDLEPLKRMFTIGGGTAQILRTQVAVKLLDMKVPQTRDGYGVGNINQIYTSKR